MPADHMEVTDIIAAINEHTGNDKAKAKDFAKVLRAGAPEVAQSLINIGGSQKATEVTGRIKELEATVKELTEAAEQKDQEITELRAKAPDAAAIEESTKRKYDVKLRKLEQERDDARKRHEDAVVQIGIDKAIAMMITPNEQGVRVDREWAEQLGAMKLRAQFAPRPDGSLAVKQIGEESEYDGTLDEKVAALVKDFRAYVPETFKFSNADGGAGIRNGTGAAGVAPGLKTQQQIIEQKRSNPAFAGI
jgi:hypothetical protein